VTVALEQLISDPRRTALLVIDMQNDFLLPGAPVPAPGGVWCWCRLLRRWPARPAS